MSVIDGALPLGMETNPLRNLAGYLRFALQRPESIAGAVRKNLGKLRARWQPRPSTGAVRSLLPVEVEIDGPEADAEVARFASSVRGIRGRLLIIRALSQTLPSWRIQPPHLGWQGFSERLTICEVPASHLGLLKDPRVRVVAKALAGAIAADEAARAQLDPREAASG